jgi:tetratricopeptide (TPR) repeat protein
VITLSIASISRKLAAAACIAIALPNAMAQRNDNVVQLLRSGDFNGANVAADSLLLTTPHDCKLLTLKGIALNGLSKPNEALRSFRLALTSCPGSAAALEGAAEIEFASHDPQVETHLKQLLALIPADPTSNAMMGELLKSRGDCGGALLHLERSRPLFRERLQLLQDQAFCFAVLQKYTEALNAYKELDQTNLSTDIRYQLAFVQWKLHQPKDALATLGASIEEGNDTQVLELASYAQEDLGNTPEAVNLLQRALLIKPRDVSLYLDFAELAVAHSSFKVGSDVLTAGIANMPKAAQLYVARGILYTQMSEVPSAIRDFETAHAIDPKMSIAVDAMGIVSRQEHHPVEALGIFRSEARLHPEDALLQYLLAEALSELAESSAGTAKEAITTARKSIALNPEYQPAYDLLTMLCLRSGEVSEALSQAKLAAAHDPGDATALYQLLLAKRRAGQNEGLKELSERISQLHQAQNNERLDAPGYRLEDSVPRTDNNPTSQQ